jgi:ubiquinone/menaquinone biosynthesis C-methylase UbiE
MSEPSLYTDLSHYYDVLCSSIDYQEQCDYAIRLHQLLGNGGQRCLDLACGSGALLAHFYARAFQCSGLDISADMLALAAERCPEAELICADMSNLHVTQSPQLITCFLYSIHYCTSIDNIQKTFRQIYAALEDGGIFCFDAVDKDCIANDEGHTHTATQNNRQLTFQTRWHYAGNGERLNLHIQIQEDTEGQRRHYSETHPMTAIKIQHMQQLLENAGFEVLIMEHDFSRINEWNSNAGNVIFCAIKNTKPN